MNINIKFGFAIDQECGFVINSANGLLVHDSSGAGRIREVSSSVNGDSIKEEFSNLDTSLKKYILHISEKNKWNIKFANISAIRIIKEHGFFELGDAIFDKELSEDIGKKVIHAITMSYKISGKKPIRIFGTEDSIKKSYRKALNIAKSLGAKRISLPIPVARPQYGVGPEKSFNIIKNLVEEFKNIEIIICADNDSTQEYCKKFI
jgi:O-acetyl-ADP-ribose deacetylase (regulator of RNase III)